MADTVQRKLTTVMSADVVGYSRLMDVDEIDTLERLKAYRQAMTGFIESHRGRVVNTAGDSLLAEFDSVVEAVQCAAEIQRELGARNVDLDENRQMLFRIGINLGDVIIEGDDIYGEGVNIAARLQGLAEPGGIFISGSTYDQVRNKLTLGYDFIGEQPVKNISEEVPIYRVLLEGAGAQIGLDVPRPLSGRTTRTVGKQAAMTPGHARDRQTAQRIYILFILSLIFGISGFAAGKFAESGLSYGHL